MQHCQTLQEYKEKIKGKKKRKLKKSFNFLFLNPLHKDY